MASQYREDFGFGDDEEFQGYISERDDDLKEHLNSEIFGDVYVDNVASDYTALFLHVQLMEMVIEFSTLKLFPALT